MGIEGVSGTNNILRLEVPDQFKPFVRSGVFRCRIDVECTDASETERASKTITIRVRSLENWV